MLRWLDLHLQELVDHLIEKRVHVSTKRAVWLLRRKQDLYQTELHLPFHLLLRHLLQHLIDSMIAVLGRPIERHRGLRMVRHHTAQLRKGLAVYHSHEPRPRLAVQWQTLAMVYRICWLYPMIVELLRNLIFYFELCRELAREGGGMLFSTQQPAAKPYR